MPHTPKPASQHSRPGADSGGGLLLVTLSRLGDMISSLGLEEALRRHVGPVDLLIRPEYSPLLADEPERRVVTLAEARRKPYALLVDLDSTKYTRPLCRRLRAGRKIGFIKREGQRWRFSFMYDVLIRRQDKAHIDGRIDALLDFLGIRERYRPSLNVNEPAGRPETDIIPEIGRVAGIHVGAGNPLRVLPDSILRPLVDFCRSHTVPVLFLGDEQEVRRAADPVFGGYPRALVLGLAELKWMIHRLAVFIGPDSGPLHLAAALGTPSIGLFGPNLAILAAPRDPRISIFEIELPCRPCDQKSCPYHQRCLTGLPVEAILDRLRILLK
ncbi:MAG: glycosyltransferase family 9 protein [Acidobacteria bacterium]|nr:glycosyltransferase family 9 protein [Acidobacteriota bacterium]